MKINRTNSAILQEEIPEDSGDWIPIFQEIEKQLFENL